MARTSRRIALVGIVATIALLAAACTGDDGDGGGGGTTGSNGGDVVEITLWHGYGKVTSQGPANLEAEAIQSLVDEWNAANPLIQVKNVFCCNNDFALQKLTTALQGGEAPDITYQYGSSLPQLAQAQGIVDLTDWTSETTVDWEDFVAGARTAATYEGKVLGVPALIDNLAIVYNKDLLEAANVDEPTTDWTWDDFRAAAAATTDPATKQFGFALPADASEDTVWHYDPLLWQAGGEILNADNTEATFNSPEGVQALDVFRTMTVEDRSVYLDTTNSKIDNLFNSGKIAMVMTGPWALGGYPDVDYGVQILPSLNGSHQTISGPDMWVVFDNGEARRAAALEFLTWFTAPEQVQKDSLMSGHLPTRVSVVEAPGFLEQFGKDYPGADVFAENLGNVLQARPVIAAYPQVSEIQGQAIVAALLGEKSSQEALDEAAQQVDDVLAFGG
jgi:multiple sugar transport system substrate-binding protein